MKLSKKSALFLIVIIISIILLAGCGLKSSDADIGKIVHILGVLNDNIMRSLSGQKVIDNNVDKIWVAPIGDGDPYNMPYGMKYAELIDINADGSFSVSVDTGISENWVLLLIDSTQSDKKDQVVGYVTMGTGDDNLLKLPVSEASGDEINLGAMDTQADSDEIKSSNSEEENADQFTLTVDQLKKIAQTDDMLKFIKNLYINYDKANDIWYTVLPEFTFRDSLDMIENRWANPGDIVNNPYFTSLGSMLFKTNDPAFTGMDLSVYSNNADIPITLTPPDTVQMENFDDSSQTTTYDNTTPIYLDGNSDPTIEYGTFRFMLAYFSVHINGNPGFPPGFWALNKDGTPYAYYDINSTYSEDANGYPKIFVPVLKANVDDNNIITSINIKWYVYDPTSDPPYTEITGDDPVLQSSILHTENNAITITIWSSDENVDDEYIRSIVPEDTVVTPTGEWNYNWQTPDQNSISGITIGIINNGMSYSFSWINRSRLGS